MPSQFSRLLLSSLIGMLFQFWVSHGVCQEAPAKDAVEQNQVLHIKNVLQRRLDQIVEREKFPGANLGVVLPNGKQIQVASGFADPDQDQKMSVDARMFCGSTGKTFVSAVALQLVGEGKLSLDDQVSKYFTGDDKEWFDKLPNAKSMTVRSIMNHTSGLPRYLFQKDYLADIKSNPDRSRKPQEGLRAIAGSDAVHEVGKGWHYSDTNYLLVGLIIEKITGKSYYEVAREKLLEPIGLNDTKEATSADLPGLVQGHVGSANFFGLPTKTVKDGRYALNPDFEWCGGGYITTAGDLARWIQRLHSGLLKDAVYEPLVTPVNMRTGQPSSTGYGLGSFVWKSDLGMFYGHAGIMPGYLTQIEFSRKHRIAVALQVNTDQGMGRQLHAVVQDLASEIVQLLNDEAKTKSDR